MAYGMNSPLAMQLAGYNSIGADYGGPVDTGANMSLVGDMGAMAQAGPMSFGAAGGGLAGAMGPASAVMGGVQSLFNMWQGFKAQKLARKQYKWNKQVTKQNLLNQMKTYNTHLADISRGRAVMEGQTPEEAAAWVAANSLSYKPWANHIEDRTYNYVNNAGPVTNTAPAVGSNGLITPERMAGLSSLAGSTVTPTASSTPAQTAGGTVASAARAAAERDRQMAA